MEDTTTPNSHAETPVFLCFSAGSQILPSFFNPVRTLKASFVCGLLAASFAVVLFSLGAFAPFDVLLWGSRATSLWSQWAGALVLGFGLAWTTIDIRQPVLQGVVAAIAFIETIAMAWILHAFGIIWPPFTAMTSGCLAIGFGLICSQSSFSRRKRLIEGTLDGRISKATFQHLLESGKPLGFSGERLESTVVVCKLFNRQLLAVTLLPGDYLELVNAFLHAGAEALKATGGTLNGCDTDSLCAVFGAPMAENDHAIQACMAARELQRQLDAFCRQYAGRWQVLPEYGIGINSGEMIAGVRGAGRLTSFSVEGEPLEFCHRLCKAKPLHGSRILLGPATFHLAGETAEARPVELRLPGETAPIELYELFAPNETR